MNLLSSYWQGASYQDNLLQSYRNLHLTLQSILIAIGAGLSIAIFTFNTPMNSILSYCLLFVISMLGFYLLLTMRKLINARPEDVDYFHNQIIEFEKTLPKEEQVLTTFKVYQKFHRNKTDINQYFKTFELTEDIRMKLTEKSKGHTRKILDTQLFIGFLIVWISFHVVSLIKVFSYFICI